MLDLAVACGITVPEHDVQRLHGQDLLLVKRFDRTVTATGILRHRMVSAATVFQADEAAAPWRPPNFPHAGPVETPPP